MFSTLVRKGTVMLGGCVRFRWTRSIEGECVDQSTRMGLQAWICNPCRLRKLVVSTEKAEIRDFCQDSGKLAQVLSGFHNVCGFEPCENTTIDMYLWRFPGLKLDKISVLQGQM